MNAFEPPVIRPTDDGSSWVCTRCGGVVGDRDVHIEWHRLLHDVLRAVSAGLVFLFVQAHPEVVAAFDSATLEGLTTLLEGFASRSE